jgi:hypothetical protein
MYYYKILLGSGVFGEGTCIFDGQCFLRHGPSSTEEGKYICFVVPVVSILYKFPVYIIIITFVIFYDGDQEFGISFFPKYLNLTLLNSLSTFTISTKTEILKKTQARK